MALILGHENFRGNPVEEEFAPRSDLLFPARGSGRACAVPAMIGYWPSRASVSDPSQLSVDKFRQEPFHDHARNRCASAQDRPP